MNRLAGNAVIAAYLGGSILDKRYKDYEFVFNEHGFYKAEVDNSYHGGGPAYLDENPSHNVWRLSDMKFDESEDWLMTVVREIHARHGTDDSFGIIIERGTTYIAIKTKGYRYIASKPQDKWEPFDIKRFYIAIVNFIYWRINNPQKK